MVVLLFLIAVAMIAAGGAAAYLGVPVIQVERGWALAIAGSGVASAGAVLLGIGVAAQRLGRVEREIRRLGDRISRSGLAAPSAPLVVADEPDGERATPPEPAAISQGREEDEAAHPAPSYPVAGTPEPPPGATVVGRYASGGNSYVMYSDGSIHADTPTGRHRFASLDELKSFVAAGGERGAA
jgi:hypothetical protein